MVGFDRTYEGLKHPRLEPHRERILEGFDRTYESLKPLFHTTLKNALPGFDRTYEGLKQLKTLVEQEMEKDVLTVPMRV